MPPMQSDPSNKNAVTGRRVIRSLEAESNRPPAIRPSRSSACHSGGGFAGIVPRNRWSWLSWKARPRVYRPKGKQLKTLVQELRSCGYRIWHAHKHRLDIHGVRVGRAFQLDSDGKLQWDKQTLLCNQDIEHFLETRSWLTPIDCELFREAWFSGYRSCDRNYHSQQSIPQS
jgi:hypothetical protein